MMKVAIFLPNWIGDVVMATPAIHALRQHFASAHLIGIFKPYVASVIEGSEWFDTTIHLDKKGRWSQHWPSAAWQLRKHRPDVAVLFPNSFRPALVAWLAGCKQRIGFNRYLRKKLLTNVLEPKRDGNGQITPSPIIDDYNRLAEETGCPNPGHRMRLYTSPHDKEAAEEIWATNHLDQYREVICLNPGAAFGAAKHWPTEYFATLAQRLIDERQCGIVVICGPNETGMAKQIQNLARRDALCTLADVQQSIGLTKACIRRSDMLITTDSGPRHFAAAFDKPVVSLFGPTHVPWTITYHPKEICLQEDVPCGPCQLRVCPTVHRCMKQLTPQKVYLAAANLMARFAPERKAS